MSQKVTHTKKATFLGNYLEQERIFISTIIAKSSVLHKVGLGATFDNMNFTVCSIWAVSHILRVFSDFSEKTNTKLKFLYFV